jgi:hypothetical protein
MATTQKVSSISSSEAMSRLAFRCALFFAPLLGLLALAVVSLYVAGELTAPERVLELQESAPVLYDPMYQPRQVYPHYKLLGTLKRHPEVLALGGSRILSIRKEFVRQSGNRFYNGYMFAAPLGSIRQFLDRIPSAQLPRYLILEIDPWWFREDAQVQPDPDFFEPVPRMQIIDFAWRNGLYLATQRWTFFAPPNLIGAGARMTRAGLRPDGSFSASERFLDAVPSLLENTLRSVREGTDEHFRYGSAGISPSAMEEMQRLLNYCSEHHVTMIGYLSTYHPSLYDTIRRDSRMDFLWRVAPALAPRFQEADALLFDLQEPDRVGCPAGEYLDAFHESEVCTAKVLLTMALQDSRAGAVFDAAKLEKFLSHRRSEWQLGF